MIISEENYIAHYGTLHKSGRYPWMSGNPDGVSNLTFLGMVDELKKKGMTEVDIASGFGMSTTQLRAKRSVAKNEQKQAQITQAQRLRDASNSNVAIGAKMGLNESSVRALLAEGVKEKNDLLRVTSDMLEAQVAKKKFVDIGEGVSNHLGISDTKLNSAVAVLREKGYQVHSVPVQQLGTGKNTTVKVLAPPDTTWGDVMRGRTQIKQIVDYSTDGGETYSTILPPLSLSPKRVAVKYAEDGGAQKDGVIYVRPGVKDVSLGGASYAQVRVLVGDSKYLKGMAMYNRDLPEGIDVVFHTNKSDTGDKLDAMKSITDDPVNPFGSKDKGPSSLKRQIQEVAPDGSRKLTSVMNLVNEEGDWTRWSKNLSSQMLSKQPPTLVKAQLTLTLEDRVREQKELVGLTNPTVKKHLLDAFADSTDSAAVHLKAAHLPRQASHVILPISSLKPDHIYAPNYNDGERVVLVRFPHGGTFEIPELVVNNKHPEAKSLLGNARDAVGIHHSVAERLSGADFDGDTVLVIPNNANKVKTTPGLDGLKNFDPKATYKKYEGMKVMTEPGTQMEMGIISNLITDMTIRGATTSELARAIRHSMVVIDARKHELNYVQSATDNGIAQLKAKYQGGRGASTLVSRARQDTRTPLLKARSAAEGGPVDKETGKLVYDTKESTYVDRNGKTVTKTTIVDRLAITDNAYDLVSANGGTPIERTYAEHSNKLKALANETRRIAVNTPPAKYSPSAKLAYPNEVVSLNAKLDLAIRNKPLERQAMVLANAIVKQKRDAHPDMNKATLKKVKTQALNDARVRTGAAKHKIIIDNNEWAAIQAGAISNDKLSNILTSADLDVVRKLATPRVDRAMTTTRVTRARQMFEYGYTRAEIAQHLGVSVSALDKVVNSDV